MFYMMLTVETFDTRLTLASTSRPAGAAGGGLGAAGARRACNPELTPFGPPCLGPFSVCAVVHLSLSRTDGTLPVAFVSASLPDLCGHLQVSHVLDAAASLKRGGAGRAPSCSEISAKMLRQARLANSGLNRAGRASPKPSPHRSFAAPAARTPVRALRQTQSLEARGGERDGSSPLQGAARAALAEWVLDSADAGAPAGEDEEQRGEAPATPAGGPEGAAHPPATDAPPQQPGGGATRTARPTTPPREERAGGAAARSPRKPGGLEEARGRGDAGGASVGGVAEEAAAGRGRLLPKPPPEAPEPKRQSWRLGFRGRLGLGRPTEEPGEGEAETKAGEAGWRLDLGGVIGRVGAQLSVIRQLESLTSRSRASRVGEDEARHRLLLLPSAVRAVAAQALAESCGPDAWGEMTWQQRLQMCHPQGDRPHHTARGAGRMHAREEATPAALPRLRELDHGSQFVLDPRFLRSDTVHVEVDLAVGRASLTLSSDLADRPGVPKDAALCLELQPPAAGAQAFGLSLVARRHGLAVSLDVGHALALAGSAAQVAARGADAVLLASAPDAVASARSKPCFAALPACAQAAGAGAAREPGAGAGAVGLLNLSLVRHQRGFSPEGGALLEVRATLAPLVACLREPAAAALLRQATLALARAPVIAAAAPPAAPPPPHAAEVFSRVPSVGQPAALDTTPPARGTERRALLETLGVLRLDLRVEELLLAAETACGESHAAALLGARAAWDLYDAAGRVGVLEARHLAVHSLAAGAGEGAGAGAGAGAGLVQVLGPGEAGLRSKAPMLSAEMRADRPVELGRAARRRCERDEALERALALAQQVQAEVPGLVQDRMRHLRTFRNCFPGELLVDWLLHLGLAPTRAAACEAAAGLVDRDLVRHVLDSRGFEDSSSLFFFVPSDAAAAPETDLSFALRLDQQPLALCADPRFLRALAGAAALLRAAAPPAAVPLPHPAVEWGSAAAQKHAAEGAAGAASVTPLVEVLRALPRVDVRAEGRGLLLRVPVGSTDAGAAGGGALELGVQRVSLSTVGEEASGGGGGEQPGKRARRAAGWGGEGVEGWGAVDGELSAGVLGVYARAVAPCGRVSSLIAPFGCRVMRPPPLPY